MTAQTEQYYSWLRKIPGELFSLDEKPLYGFPPPFPWDKFSEELANTLHASDLQISPEEIQWRSIQDLLSGLGENVTGLQVAVNPLPGKAWWIMPRHSIVRLMIQLLSKGEKDMLEKEIDPDFLQAFYCFFATEAINSFEKIGSDKKLSAVIANTSSLPEEICLCLDVSLSMGKEHHYGRLCLSNEFRRGWTQHYLKQGKSLLMASPLADTLDVIVHLQAGKIDLKPSEWKQVAVGDFVIIDSCSIDPDEDKGRVMLVINGIPCFRGRMKNGSLKILEHPLYHEVDKAMATPPPPTNPDSPAPQNSGNPPPDNQDPPNKDNEDEDLFNEEEPENEKNENEESEEGEEGKESKEGEEEKESEEGEEEFEISDEDLDFEEIEKSVPEAPTEAKMPAPAPSPKPEAAAPEEKEKKVEGVELMPEPVAAAPLSAEDIPLPVVIEVGRIQMTVKQLMELQPGNMLDLDIHPESGVDMVVNGKRIARGDLMRIGDALGIRITQLS